MIFLFTLYFLYPYFANVLTNYLKQVIQCSSAKIQAYLSVFLQERPWAAGLRSCSNFRRMKWSAAFPFSASLVPCPDYGQRFSYASASVNTNNRTKRTHNQSLFQDISIRRKIKKRFERLQKQSSNLFSSMRSRGLEPPRGVSPHGPEPCASANSATTA